MKLKAYPKINLCLKVFKEKHEHKHQIDSVFFLYKKIYDEIKIKKSNDLFVLYRDCGKSVSLSDCAITRALRYLKNKYGIDVNYQIEVDKHIPFGAGLGGASSDAAVVINYVLQQNPSIILDLKEIAQEIGSDIPFFLSHYQMARVRRCGEFVSPIYNWRPKITLHFNETVCLTKDVFELVDQDKNYSSRVNVDQTIDKHLYKQHLTNVVYNDLTKYIIQKYKELQDEYKKYKNNSFFTGAGSTIVTIEDKYES